MPTKPLAKITARTGLPRIVSNIVETMLSKAVIAVETDSIRFTSIIIFILKRYKS